MKEYSHYIFDFDMTLFDTMTGLELCYSAAFKAIGVDYNENELSHYVGENLDKTYCRYNKNMSNFACFEETFLKTSAKLMCQNSSIYNDTYATIMQLYRCGKKLSIATGKPKERVVEILKKYGMDQCFGYICGYGDYVKSKPDAESIEKCISWSGISKENTIYIGDSKNDIIAAKRAGIDSALIDRENITENPNTINSLLELLREFEICMFTVMTSEYDILEKDNAAELLKKFCMREGYHIVKFEQLQCVIQVDNNRKMYINRYGLVIITERVNCYSFDAGEILNYKENLNKENLHNDQTAVQKIFFGYCQWVKQVADKQIGRETKISYTLVSYLCKVYTPGILNYYSETVKEVLLLLLKSEAHPKENFEQKGLLDVLELCNIPFVSINSRNFLAAMWGARVFVTTDENMQVFGEYVEEEGFTQNLWMLFSSNNKMIDQEVARGLELHELVGKSYDVLSYESNIKYINALRKHRYQVEISQLLFRVSNLDVIEKYFNEKVGMLERKIVIESSKQEKESDYKMNITLFILTIISSVSAIFQIVNYWNDNSNNNLQSILWSIVSLCIISLFLVSRLIVKKIHQATIKKRTLFKKKRNQ